MTSRLPWTKFQDFYLRLGFLKVLVAALSPERRSAANDAIIRRLQTPLFDSATRHETLVARLGDLFDGIYPRRTSSGKEIEHPEVAEAMLAVSSSASALYGITRETAYKILDWGHDVDLVGRANQITERGLLLKSLLSKDRPDEFLAGDVGAWNPLHLTLRERLFFLYHLVEIDLLTVELIRDLGSTDRGAVLESRDAAKKTCLALLRVLEGAEKTLDARDIVAFRTAQELAIAIADELEEPIPSAWGGVARQLRTMRASRVASKAPGRAGDTGRPARKTTKNADHQTIPRFEQLVDLGFLTKPGVEDPQPRAALAARRRWRYAPTDICRRWALARSRQPIADASFKYRAFARTAVSAFHDVQIASIEDPTPRLIGDRLWRGYSEVKRSAGLSPLDSVALVAMVDAAADGIAIEMDDFHSLLLAIKERNVLTDCVFFASGNALDKMFIQLKGAFPQRFNEVAPQLGLEAKQ